MKIIFSDDQDEVKVPKKAVALLKEGLQAVAKLHKLSAETEVDVSLVSDEVIHVLNKDYRGMLFRTSWNEEEGGGEITAIV